MKWVAGAAFVLAGVGWFVTSATAVAMASRGTTGKENAIPFLGLVLAAIGIAIMIWS